LGLLEALNDFKMKSHHLHTCALSINELLHELTITRPRDVATLQDFRRRYSDVMRSCPVNHSRVDYLFVNLEKSTDRWSRTAIYFRYVLDVYGLYAVFLAVPPMIWWLH
jgi:hypothetical protein